MEGFTYVDIFATKGIEYLLVIGFLLVFVFFWKALSTPSRAAYRYLTENVIPAISEWFQLPEGIYCHQGHSWAQPEGNLVRVGMDDFAQKLAGKPEKINLPGVGSQVGQGSRAWRLTFGSTSIDMLSPLNGEVIAINDEVVKKPDLVNQDPYGKGWLMMIKPNNLEADVNNLLSGRFAKAWMGETVESLRDRMGGGLGQVYQDGGVLVDGIAKNLDREKWDEIVKEYFLVS